MPRAENSSANAPAKDELADATARDAVSREPGKWGFFEKLAAPARQCARVNFDERLRRRSLRSKVKINAFYSYIELCREMTNNNHQQMQVT